MNGSSRMLEKKNNTIHVFLLCYWIFNVSCNSLDIIGINHLVSCWTGILLLHFEGKARCLQRNSFDRWMTTDTSLYFRLLLLQVTSTWWHYCCPMVPTPTSLLSWRTRSATQGQLNEVAMLLLLLLLRMDRRLFSINFCHNLRYIVKFIDTWYIV